MRTGTTITAELKRVPNPPTTAGVTPYCPIYYYTVGAPHDAGGEWTRIDNLGTKNRTLDVTWSVEPFQGKCTIVFDNSESSYDATATNYKAKWLKIDPGLTISATPTVPTGGEPAYFYCTGYAFSSDVVDGHAIDTLTLYGEGAWNRLGRLLALDTDNTPAFYYNNTTLDADRASFSIREILSDATNLLGILDMAGIDLGADIGTVDTYVDSLEPSFTFGDATQVGDAIGPTGDVAVMILLLALACRVVPRGDTLCLAQLVAVADWTFKCPTDASYQPFTGGKKSVVDSGISAVKVPDAAGTTVGEYGSGSNGSYLWGWPSIWYSAPTEAQLDHMAESFHGWYGEQEENGTINGAILNPLLELYDYVTVTDGRGNISTSGYIGGLFYHYAPQKRVYHMTVRLGGLVSGTGTTAQEQSHISNFITARTTSGLANDIFMSRLFAPALKPWSTTLTFSPKGGDTHDSVSWAAGVIKWNDGTTADQVIDAGEFANIAAGTVNYIYFTKGSATLVKTTSLTTALGNNNGLLAEVYVSSTYADGTIGIQPYMSKGLNILGDFIAAKSISAAHIQANSITVSEADSTFTGRLFTDSTNRSTVEGWKHATGTTQIDGGDIYTGTVTAEKITVGPANYLDDPSFERSGTAGGWIGWTETAGTGWAWATGTDSRGADATKSYASCYDSATDHALRSAFVRCNYGDILTASMWAMTNNTGIKASCEVYLAFYKEDKTTAISDAHTHAAKDDTSWHEVPVTAAAPAGTSYVVMHCHITGAADPTGYVWLVDDCSLFKASQIVVHGTPGGTRTEINANGIEGYSDATTKQFYLRASDGKALCGAGAVILDADGIKVTGTTLCRFFHGTTYTGEVYADSGGLHISAEAGDLYLCSNDSEVVYVLGQVKMTQLPTSDPEVVGALWNSSGTMKISAGPPP